MPVEAEDVLHLAELTLHFWEASMTWWNMTKSEKQPWIDMFMFNLERWSRDHVILEQDLSLEQGFFKNRSLASA